jgi:hypothetical protein
MAYGWIITKDLLYEDNPALHNEHDIKSAAGTMGPHGVRFTKEDILKGKEFKMYDDDMILYYEGRIVGDYSGFEPLDDFGMPDSSCTSIWYDGVQL